MPRIPEAASAGPSRARPTPLGFATAVSETVAAEAGKQADVLFAAAAAESAALRETQFATQQAAMVGRLTQRKIEAEDSADPNAIVSTYGPLGREDVASVLANTPDKAVRQELERIVPGLLLDHDFNLKSTQRARQKKDYRAAFPGLLKIYSDGIAVAIDEGNDEQAASLRESARSLMGGSPHHTGAEISKMLPGFDIDIDLRKANEVLAENPELLIGMSTREMIDAYPSLDTDLRQELQAKAKAKFGAEAISTIEISVAGAESLSGLNTASAQTTSLHEAGLIGPEKNTQVQKQIIARRAAIVRETGDLTRYDQIMAGMPAFGTEDQKAMDAGYPRDMAAANIQSIDDLHALELDMVRRSKMVPSQIPDRLNRIWNSGDIPLIESAAQHFQDIKQIAPQVLKSIDEPARIMLDNVSEAARVGVPAAQVVEQTMEFLRRDPSTQIQFESMWDAALKDEPSADWLISRAEDTGWFSADVDVPLEILGPFTTRSHAHYLSNPKAGIKKAYEKTFEDMSLQWGSSRVGRAQFMSHPPEKAYKEWSGDSSALQEHLVDDVAGDLSQLPAPIVDAFEAAGFVKSQKAVREFLEDRDLVFITSDGQSSREYGRIPAVNMATGELVEGSERLTPGYRVWFRDPANPEEPILWTQADGITPQRWYPSFFETEGGRAVQAEIKRDLEEAAVNRELRAQRESGIMPPSRVDALKNAFDRPITGAELGL